MRKRVLAILIGLCAAVTMFPAFAFAEIDEATEFVAVSRFVIKSIDENGVIHIKKSAPKPTSEEVTALENGYSILFAEKKGEAESAVYTVIRDTSKITCADSSVNLYFNEGKFDAGNFGTYGESSDEIKTIFANIFAQEVGTYTFNYKGQSVKIEIKLPDYGFYTKPEATVQNQLRSAVRFEAGKETTIYMIAANPEQLKKIEFSFHDEKMEEYATLEQMGEYGEICKITVTQPTDFIWVHCGRTFLNGDYDNSGNGVGVVVRPEKTALHKLFTSSKTIKASWSKQPVVGYQVKIATNKVFTKGVKTYNVSSSNKTFKKLAKGKRYYVKSRAYRYAGMPYYGKWSNVRSLICK